MRNIKYLFIALLLFSFSCTKQTIQTSASEITAEIQRVIKENYITRIIAWDDKSGYPTNIPPSLGGSWSFSNGFITISGYGSSPNTYYRNLLYLDSYEVTKVLLNDGSNPIVLVLHFKS